MWVVFAVGSAVFASARLVTAGALQLSVDKRLNL